MIPPRSLPLSFSFTLSICQTINPKEIRVNFSLAPFIPLSADPLLPWSAFGGRSSGLCWCVPVVAPLSGCCAPGDRPARTLEVHRGRAGAKRLSDPSLASIDISYSIRGSVQPPVSRQGRRGACVSYGTFPEIARKAHCCSGAPPLPPRLYQCRSPWSGRGREGWETSLGSSRVILLHQQATVK